MRRSITESDLTRIVNRVIKEQSSSTEGSVTPKQCKKSDLLSVKSDLMNGKNSYPFRVENAKSFDNKDYKNTLVVTTPNGSCYCTPSEFFG